MASVQELILAAQAEKSPFISLLEGAAQGFGTAQSEGLGRAKSLIDMENDRQARERAKETHDKLLKMISGAQEQETSNAFKQTGIPKKSALPSLRLDQVTMGTSGYFKPEFKVDAPKSYQTKEYQDAKGKNRIGRFDPLSATFTTSPDDPLAPASSSQVGGALSNDLRKEFIGLPEVKEYNTVATSVKGMDALLNKALGGDIKNKAALDQALITMYNKLTDPQSVVRESEYARTPENLPTVNRIYGALAKVQTGGAGLTDDDRKALVIGAKIIANVRGQMFSERRTKYNELAGKMGADPTLVTGTIEDFKPFDLGNWKQIGNQKVRVKGK